MTPPRMYVEGQNETKVCRESTQLYREMMMISMEIESFCTWIKKKKRNAKRA
jgi:hypothetical protein